MTNVSKISLLRSLRNVLEDTRVRQIARFSCVCPRLIVSLRRETIATRHLATQTYWIKKDVSPLFWCLKTANYFKYTAKQEDYRPWFSTGCFFCLVYRSLGGASGLQMQAVRASLCQSQW